MTHLVSNCRSYNNCQICDDRHHTLIHTESLTNTETLPTSSNNVSNTGFRPTSINNDPSFTSTGTSSQRQVFHTRQNTSVLLGTATLNIIHNGNTYRARALIDSASECSFISDQFRKRLKLPAQPTNSKIFGVNNTVSNVCKKVCYLKIGSDLDSSITLNSKALVLPSISGNLPSFSVSTDLTEVLPTLHLADPKPFEKGPIDILIGADLYPQIMLSDMKQGVLGSLLAQNTIFGWILTGPVDFESVNKISHGHLKKSTSLI